MVLSRQFLKLPFVFPGHVNDAKVVLIVLIPIFAPAGRNYIPAFCSGQELSMIGVKCLQQAADFEGDWRECNLILHPLTPASLCHTSKQLVPRSRGNFTCKISSRDVSSRFCFLFVAN